MSIHSVTFNVDQVVPSTFTPKGITPQEIFNNILGKEIKFETVAKTYNQLFDRPRHTNSFFAACHTAYAEHYGLELHVDHVKLTIMHAFAIHVNENSESLRSKLVSFDGKKELEVIKDEFIRGSINNDWNSVFLEFGKKIQKDVLDCDLVQKIQNKTQTTTSNTMVALNISLMDCFQKYYNYVLKSRCGIPNVTLKGSVDDWKSLKDLTDCISKYDFNWFTEKLNPILDQFIAAAEGNPDNEFWKNMVKSKNSSGGPYYDGWIKYLFPYRLNTHNKTFYMADFNETFTSSSIPDGMSSVPMLWKYLNEEFNMMLHAGFVGMSYINGIVMPEVLWAVIYV